MLNAHNSSFAKVYLVLSWLHKEHPLVDSSRKTYGYRIPYVTVYLRCFYSLDT